MDGYFEVRNTAGDVLLRMVALSRREKASLTANGYEIAQRQFDRSIPARMLEPRDFVPDLRGFSEWAEEVNSGKRTKPTDAEIAEWHPEAQTAFLVALDS